MICPRCDAEYVDGVEICLDCGEPLVEPESQVRAAMPKPRIGETRPEPQVVFSSGRAEMIAIAKSILMAANIEYAVRGEEIQDMFGYGRFPAGHNLISGPMEIIVASADAADARAVLAELSSAVMAPPVYDEEPTDDLEARGMTFTERARVVAKIAAIILLLVMGSELLLYLTN